MSLPNSGRREPFGQYVAPRQSNSADGGGYDTELWARPAELGVTGLTTDEKRGGVGAGHGAGRRRRGTRADADARAVRGRDAGRRGTGGNHGHRRAMARRAAPRV